MMKLCILLTAILVLKGIAPEARAEPAFASVPVEKDGLQVTVFGDKTPFARNEPIKFTVRFKNITDKQVSLEYADEFQYWGLRLEEVTSKMPWRLQGLSDETRPVRQPRILMPGETVEVSTDWGSNRFPFRYESELILNMPMPPADSLRPGRYRIWIGINFKWSPELAAAHMGFKGDINLGPVEIEIGDQDDPAWVQTSDAVKENNADFQTVTRPKWLIPAVGAKSEAQIGLKVTNRTGTWMQINVLDTVQLVLEDAHGTDLQSVRERDASFIPAPLILEPRESRTIYRNATLEWSKDGKTLRLSGPDGAGGHWHFDLSKPGNYALKFVYANNKTRLERPVKGVIDPKEAPFWTGNVTTKALAVELVDAPRGR